eukprot:5141752-Ditylum_brightwellii.AAC.1
MRVYCEDQLMDDLLGNDDSDYVPYVPSDLEAGYRSKFYAPSAIQDAEKCRQHLYDFLVICFSGIDNHTPSPSAVYYATQMMLCS